MQIHKTLALGSLVVLTAGLAYAADQTILGKSLVLHKGSTPTHNSITVGAKESGSPNAIVGDPTSGGATLTVTANGGTPSQQVFNLPASNWTSTGTGFKYKDSHYLNGAVRFLRIKKSTSGRFTMSARASSRSAPITVLPPNPGTSGCALLAVGGGDTYSVAFSTGTIVNKVDKTFKVKRPTAEGTCVTTTTTTSTTTSSTTTSSTTSTTLYGSPSRAFVDRVFGLLD